jgi:hypothetical protein
MAQFGQTQQKEDTSNLTEAQQIELNYEKLKSIVENPKESKFGSNILFNKQQYEQAKALLPEYERYFSEKKAYEEEKRKYEQKQEEASRYAEGYNLFFDDLKYGMHGRYLVGHNESFVKGYEDARKYLAKEQARYGSAETVAKYGTQAEKARFFNLPEGATNFVYNKDGSFSYDTSEGKISIIPNKVNIPTPSNPQNVEVVGYNTIVESGGIKTFFDNKGNVKGYETSGFPYGEQSIMVRQPEDNIEQQRKDLISQGIDPDTKKPILTVEETKGTLNKISSAGIPFVSGFVAGVSKDIMFFKKIFTQSPITSGKEIGKGFYEVGRKIVTGEGFPEISYLLMAEPTYLLGYAGEQYLTAKGLGKVTEITSKGVKLTTTYLAPDYTAITKFNEGKLGFKIPSQELIEGKVIKIAEPLTSKEMKLTSFEQVELSGKKIDAVSAARDFFKVFNKEVEINKPIVEGSPLIEKSLFFDPSGKLRVSRLIEDFDKPKFMDYFTEDLTFIKPKAQALIYEGAEVEKFPKSLNIIKSKIQRNIPLNLAEQQKLLEWQLTPSGKLKPIGKIKSDGTPTSEPEVTAAPKEILQKERRLGRTIYKGVPISLYKVSLKGASSEAKEALKGLKKGIIDKEKIALLEKETGLDLSYLRNEKYISPYSSISYFKSLIYDKDYYKEAKYIKYKEEKYGVNIYQDIVYAASNYPYNKIIYKEIQYPPKTVYPPKLIYPPEEEIPPIKEIITPEYEERIEDKEIGSSQKGYNVYAKGVSLGKNKKEGLVKINTQPVTKTEAFDIGAYATDTSLSRKFLIKPTKQQAEPSNLSFPRGYFEANIEKFRSFKVKQGKKQALQDEFIEKSGFALDTSGERKKITIAKKIAEIRKSGRTPIDSDINFATNLID